MTLDDTGKRIKQRSREEKETICRISCISRHKHGAWERGQCSVQSSGGKVEANFWDNLRFAIESSYYSDVLVAIGRLSWQRTGCYDLCRMVMGSKGLVSGQLATVWAVPFRLCRLTETPGRYSGCGRMCWMGKIWVITTWIPCPTVFQLIFTPFINYVPNKNQHFLLIVWQLLLLLRAVL